MNHSSAAQRAHGRPRPGGAGSESRTGPREGSGVRGGAVAGPRDTQGGGAWAVSPPPDAAQPGPLSLEGRPPAPRQGESLGCTHLPELRSRGAPPGGLARRDPRGLGTPLPAPRGRQVLRSRLLPPPGAPRRRPARTLLDHKPAGSVTPGRVSRALGAPAPRLNTHGASGPAAGHTRRPRARRPRGGALAHAARHRRTERLCPPGPRHRRRPDRSLARLGRLPRVSPPSRADTVRTRSRTWSWAPSECAGRGRLRARRLPPQRAAPPPPRRAGRACSHAGVWAPEPPGQDAGREARGAAGRRDPRAANFLRARGPRARERRAPALPGRPRGSSKPGSTSPRAAAQLRAF